MILVAGATGKIGRELVMELKIRRTAFKVLARDPSKANALLGPVDCVHGDFNVPEKHDSALAGVESVFLLAPADPRMVSWETAFARAAKDAGVKRLVAISAPDADARARAALTRWHGEIEEELKRLSLSLVVLRPAYLYQNFLALAPLILRGVLPGPMGTARLAMVDARDVAKVAARALAEPVHDGRTYLLTGPAPVSYGEAASILAKVLGRPVDYADTPPETARTHMLEGGLPPWKADALLEWAAAVRAGRADVSTTSVKDVTGSDPLPLDSFLQSHRASF